MSWFILIVVSKVCVLGLLLSCILVIVSLGVLFVKGFNFGFDFIGGYIIEINIMLVIIIIDLKVKLSFEVVSKLIIIKVGEYYFVLREVLEVSKVSIW